MILTLKTDLESDVLIWLIEDSYELSFRWMGSIWFGGSEVR